jgi:LysM repeat protein
MLRRLCLAVAVSSLLAGCSQDASQPDDVTNPHYKQAQQDLDNNNPTAAIADYEQALAANPKLAGAHYELGLIYGDKLSDPVGAIYHFRRYLELAPNSDKSADVKTLIDKETQEFTASQSSSAATVSDDTTKLQADNATLKKQVDDATHTIAALQAELSKPGKHRAHLAMKSTPPPATGEAGSGPLLADNSTAPSGPISDTPAVSADAAPTNAASGTPPRAVAVDTNSPDVNAAPPSGTNAAAAPAGPSRSYTVVKGDSFWKIAHKMYPGDTKNGEDKIIAANPGLSPKKLKIGQVLVIPQ